MKKYLLLALCLISTPLAAAFWDLHVQGDWNPNTNIPKLQSGAGQEGLAYRVSADGSFCIDSLCAWKQNDLIYFDHTQHWRKLTGPTIDSSAVTFTQSGTNALTMPMQTKVRQVVNVNDFTGADPTGAADSLAAITNAINSFSCAGATTQCGGTVNFGPGTYCVSSPIVLTGKHGTRLIGAGPLATKITPCGQGDFPIVLDAGLHASQTGQLEVRDMHLHCGGYAGHPMGTAVSFANTSYGWIENVFVTGCYTGFYARNVWQVSLIGSNIHGGAIGVYSTDRNYQCVLMDMPNYGSTFTASIAGTLMTVTSGAVAPRTIYLGGGITGTGVTAGTKIVSMIDSTHYIVSASQTVASTTITQEAEVFADGAPYNNAVLAKSNICSNPQYAGARIMNGNGSLFSQNQWQYGLYGVYYCDPPTPGGVNTYPDGATKYQCAFQQFVQDGADTTDTADWALIKGAAYSMGEGVTLMNPWAGSTGNNSGTGYAILVQSATNLQVINASVEQAPNSIQNNRGVVFHDTFTSIFSGHILNYNNKNDGSAAFTFEGITGGNSATVVAVPFTGSPSVGYNGIVETGTYAENQVYGGPASCGSTIGLAFGGAAASVTSGNICAYEIHGVQVVVRAYLELTSLNGHSGAATITGLPVATDTETYSYGSVGALLAYSNFSGITGGVFAQMLPGTSTANLRMQGATGVGNLADTNFSVSPKSLLLGTLSYIKQ